MKPRVIVFVNLALALLLCGCAAIREAVATATPTPTPTLTPTATPTPLPVATPTATPVPAAAAATTVATAADWPLCSEVLVGDALRAEVQALLWRGEYDVLLPLLESKRNDATQPAGAVELCMAMAYLADGDLATGVELVLPWAQQTGPLQHQALAMLADAYTQAGQWQPAATSYELLLALDPPAPAYVAWRAAQAYVQLGDSAQALRLLQGIDTATLPTSFRAEVLEELARIARESNQWELALQALDEIQTFAVQPGYRMLVEVERAHTLLSISDYDTAIPILNQAMSAYPDQAAGQQAFLLLKALAEEQPTLEAAQVAPLIAARVQYYAGLYEEADEAVSKALKTRDADRAEAYALRGLIAAAQGSPRSALAALDKAITLYNQKKLDDPVVQQHVAEVWLTKAEVVQANGDDPSKVYALFVSRYGDYPEAPRALWLAAQYWDEKDDAGRASDFYARLAHEYPESTLASTAILRTGLVWYRQGELAKAQAAWADELARLKGAADATQAATEQAESVDLEALASAAADEAWQLARLNVWLGITHAAAGELETAEALWTEAATLDPEGYYGVRAADLLAGATLRLPLQSPDLPADAAADWDAIADWVTGWADSAGADVGQAELEAGLWLWRVGWDADALSALGALADRQRENAPLMATLGRETEAAGIYLISTLAAEYLLDVGREQGAPEAPQDVWRAMYPLAYADLVQENAAAYGLDPLLFTALLRQESRFHARAISSADARGLAQVIPSTGAWIAESLDAESLGADGYRTALLYRPYLSVEYGAWYLDFCLGLRERDWPAALAAYNGGPGNLASWTEGQDELDYDLFAETIPANETRSYVKTIYLQYRLYQRIYQQPAP